MARKIQLQTPDGVQDYLFIANSIEYEQAIADELITNGMEIVYRQYLVHILPDMSMLILTQVAPQAVPNYAGFDPGMSHMSFTINGVPVSAEQFNAAMGGMHV